MTENIKKLLELASSNEELKSKLNKVTKEELIALAKEQGIELTNADFEAQSGELSDDELNAVAGGKKCTCVLGGGGTASAGEKTCACVASGFGLMADNNSRCMCAVYGTGCDEFTIYTPSF